MIGGRGVSWFGYNNYKQSILYGFENVLIQSCSQQFKKCILIESLKENISGYINRSFNLIHVSAGFTKGTHHVLHLHTKYFLI